MFLALVLIGILVTMSTTDSNKRQWRAYMTDSGNCPVDEFLTTLSDDDFMQVAAAMKEVRLDGLAAARHLRSDIYEVRASGTSVIYRILFAAEGHILLALEAFRKKTRVIPQATIVLAEHRLADWRRRGAAKISTDDRTNESDIDLTRR